MQDARLGKAVEMDKVSPVVENITASILRNAGALLSLSHQEQGRLHLPAFGQRVHLLVAFCRSRKMDEETIYQAGIGGLLHDTGKALVPDQRS
jgi:response regulator RpfG family c-di-GMP phosphodiesterase